MLLCKSKAPAVLALSVSCFVPVYEHAAPAAARPAATVARREDNSMVPAATRAHKPQIRVPDRSAATALHLHICTVHLLERARRVSELVTSSG